MSPAAFVAATVRAAERHGRSIRTGMVIPNVIDAGVYPTDLASWGPLVDRQEADVAAALRERVLQDDALLLLGDPRVSIRADRSASPHRPRYTMRLEQRIDQPADAAAAEDRHSRPTSYSPASLGPDANRSTQRLCELEMRVDGVPAWTVVLHEGRHVIGRGERCKVRIDNPTVSLRHAELTVAPEGLRVRNLDSTNGVLVAHDGTMGNQDALRDDDDIVLSGTVSLRILRGGGRPVAIAS
ncbi:MAG: FHA domain-containing protein [Conexibacter sp.]